MTAGLTHVYYGDGKGKTTAALGLALRAAGCGKSVVFIQFLKDWNCGEINALKLVPNVTVLRATLSGATFFHEMTDADKAATRAMHDENLMKALDMQKDGDCDMLVLDEVIDAYNIGAMDASIFESLLNNKPASLELVITGHNPPSWILEHADYVTEMVKRKHPYDNGVLARKGVEF